MVKARADDGQNIVQAAAAVPQLLLVEARAAAAVLGDFVGLELKLAQQAPVLMRSIAGCKQGES